MYMNGRGPMGGHRGGMGGPGFRPVMRRHRRPMGLFPLGGFFILPGLLFGGWIAVAVLGGILSLFGTVIGGVFRGVSSLASHVFSGSGIAAGILIGLLAFFGIRRKAARKADQENAESAGTVDGEAVETEIVEPVHYNRMNG